MDDSKHRQSMRLRLYDYTTPGAYFVTICTKNRECMFGRVENGEMKLNEIGKIVEYWWSQIPGHFQNVGIDGFVVMPDHFHGILWLVGADRCVRPSDFHQNYSSNNHDSGTHVGVPLPRIIQWFKTMTTNRYFRFMKQNNKSFGSVLWQRNYYERVIRNDAELFKIRRYILENPAKWETEIEENQGF
jgi:putative transposase